MLANVIPLNAGFALTDPDDLRYVYFYGVRERFGIFLHNASKSLRHQGEENTVDAVQMLVSSLSRHDISLTTEFRFGPFEHI
jgi:proteasome activator subunit 4